MSYTKPSEWQRCVEREKIWKHILPGTVTSVPQALSKQRPVHPSVLSSESTSERLGLGPDSPVGGLNVYECVVTGLSVWQGLVPGLAPAYRDVNRMTQRRTRQRSWQERRGTRRHSCSSPAPFRDEAGVKHEEGTKGLGQFAVTLAAEECSFRQRKLWLFSNDVFFTPELRLKVN